MSDRPPASEDDWTQNYLEKKWRAIEQHLDVAMSELREIWPEMTALLPETGGNHIHRALENAESAFQSIHDAGPHVLGSAEYNNYMSSKTESRVERST